MSLRDALWTATLALYTPQFVPFVVGPLRECQHCVGTYWKLFPIALAFLPGAWLVRGLGLEADEGWGLLLIGGLAATLFGLVVLVLRRLRRTRIVVVVVAALACAHALALSHVLRA